MTGVAILIALASSWLIHLTEAWGKDGHQIVANLAWKLLSTQAQDEIEAILHLAVDDNDDDKNTLPWWNNHNNQTSDSPLAIVADWADEIRYNHLYRWTAPLHYIDIQDNVPNLSHAVVVTSTQCPADCNHTGQHMSASCHFYYARDCVDNRCVAGAIVNYTHQLFNRQKQEYKEPRTANTLDDTLQRQEALKFVTHFIGDIHQPLHASRASDKGGNSIHVTYLDPTLSTPISRRSCSDMDNDTIHSSFFRRRHRHSQRRSSTAGTVALHAVWDDSLIETSMRHDFAGSRSAMEEDLFHYLRLMHDTNASIWSNWTACLDGSNVSCTTAWGEESFEYAMLYAYQNVDGTEIGNGMHLMDDYYISRLPIVRDRLVGAGVRLAATLDSILGPSFRTYMPVWLSLN